MRQPFEKGREPVLVRRGQLVVMLVLLSLALAPNIARAQVLYGSVVGAVKDAQGAAIPAATVVITNKETNLTRETVTGNDGEYTVANVVPGRYDVKVHVHHEAPVEIHRLAEAFGDMAGKIERQMADQRELLASVSHEVRSPLARVRLVLEMLRDEKLTTEGREKLLGELDHEVEEIDDLVGGLLASSRVDFSALTLRPHDLVAAARASSERRS